MSSDRNSNNNKNEIKENVTEITKENKDSQISEKKLEKSEDSLNKNNLNNNKKDLSSEKEDNKISNNDKSEITKESNINEIMTKMINTDQDWEMHPTEGPIGMSSAEKDPEEYRHLRNVVSAFFNYQIDSLRDLARTERDFKSIDEKYLKRMSFNYTERLDKLKKAIWLNYSFLLKVADPYKNMFKLYKGKNGEVLMEPLLVEVKDIIKMRSTLRLFTRDWAIDGIDERSSTYKPILNELKKFFENKTKKEFQEGINILVPGAGLGRLMYEIAKLGFKSQGNEFSYYMGSAASTALSGTATITRPAPSTPEPPRCSSRGSSPSPFRRSLSKTPVKQWRSSRLSSTAIPSTGSPLSASPAPTARPPRLTWSNPLPNRRATRSVSSARSATSSAIRSSRPSARRPKASSCSAYSA